MKYLQLLFWCGNLHKMRPHIFIHSSDKYKFNSFLIERSENVAIPQQQQQHIVTERRRKLKLRDCQEKK